MSVLHWPTATTWSRSATPSGNTQAPGSKFSAASAMGEIPWLTTCPILAIALLSAVSIASPGLVQAIAVPLAVVGAALGIPHGAVDFLVPRWWTTESAHGGRDVPRVWLRRLVFLGAYAGVAGIGLVALILIPTPTLVVFLILSAVHFGRGEVVTAAERAGRYGSTAAQNWLSVLAHGLVVVGLLVWAAPAAIDPFLRPLSPWLAHATVVTRGPGLISVGLIVTVTAILLWKSGRRLETTELLLLAGTFCVAPPLAAFGVYFGAWHSVRHTGRLLDLTRERRSSKGWTDTSWTPAAWQLTKASTAPTLVALAAVAALWLARDLASLQAEVAVLLALTFPHAAAVWVLDRQQSQLT